MVRDIEDYECEKADKKHIHITDKKHINKLKVFRDWNIINIVFYVKRRVRYGIFDSRRNGRKMEYII